ncbi:hypothetical protein [Ramlibacter albus]|uniref:Uncharacterized protein n=1 Tax=Ramlibacter albus TaxID=2079448 RepID=A0A923MBC1_9BURK|nr:hypothetical protein [Ramlibacter albus]MBC5765932.1 hypothetical protein [Ramlibacter albus]
MFEQTGSSAPASFAEQLVTVDLPQLEDQVALRFERVVRAVIRRELGECPAAQAALESCSLVKNGVTMVLRLDRESDAMSVFADLGAPPDCLDHAGALGKLLEMNLHNTHPGVLFGRNRDSGRLVAFMRCHMFALDDEGEVCIGCLELLSRTVQAVRTW